MKRLIEETVSRGLSPRTRRAAAPTSNGWSAPGKWTTEGVRRRPSASAMSTGKPASITPTRALVVPRSMPTILLIVHTIARAGQACQSGRGQTHSSARTTFRLQAALLEGSISQPHPDYAFHPDRTGSAPYHDGSLVDFRAGRRRSGDFRPVGTRLRQVDAGSHQRNGPLPGWHRHPARQRPG